MQITNNLHAFIWQSMTANNCNAYFIDGPTRVLIDPGHRALFDHPLASAIDHRVGRDDRHVPARVQDDLGPHERVAVDLPLHLLQVPQEARVLGLGVLRIVCALPGPLARGVGRALGRFAHAIAGSRRGVVRRNIELCFPDLDSSGRDRLAKQPDHGWL